MLPCYSTSRLIFLLMYILRILLYLVSQAIQALGEWLLAYVHEFVGLSFFVSSTQLEKKGSSTKKTSFPPIGFKLFKLLYGRCYTFTTYCKQRYYSQKKQLISITTTILFLNMDVSHYYFSYLEKTKSVVSIIQNLRCFCCLLCLWKIWTMLGIRQSL